MGWPSFMHPAYFWALPLSVLPLVIHIMSRRRKRVVEFGSVRFLLTARRQNVERLNLREILLLVLRTFVVLLIVLAAARPLVRGFGAGAITDHEPTGVVLVIDRTLSMRFAPEGESLFERSIDRARSVIGLLRKDDRVRIFTTDREVVELTTGEAIPPDEAGDLLDGEDASCFRGRLDEGVQRAVQACREIDLPWREVYVFTDLQRGSITPGLFDGMDDDIPIVFFTEGDARATNRYLGRAEIVHEGEGEEKGRALKIVVGSSGAATSPGVFPRLYIDGEMAGIAEVQIEGEGEKTATFPMHNYPGSRKRMRVEIEEDELHPDDTRYIMSGETKPLRIMRGNGISSMSSIMLALDLLEDLYRETGRSGGEMRPEGGGAQQESRVLVTTWSDREGIRQATRKGYGMVIYPDPDRDLPSGGSLLRVSSAGRKVMEGGGYQTIAPIGGTRLPPLLYDMADGFGRVRVMDYYRLMPDEKWEDGAAAESWRIDMDNGDPFLMGWNAGGVRVVMWSIAPEEGSSNILVSPLFVPVLDAALQFAAGSGEDRGYFCGEIVVKNLPGISSGGTVVCTYPDGSEALLVAGPAGEVRFADTGEPGFYAFSDGLRILSQFPVNVDTGESIVTGMDPLELEEMIQSQNVHLVEKGDGLEQAMLSKRGGREISSWLLFSVFILILAESLISGRIHRE